LKNKKSGRSDLRRQYRTHVIANILYSTLVAGLVEIVLVLNMSFLADYAHKAQWDNALLAMIYNSDIVIVLGYVLLGIAIFSVTFLLLQERSIDYISRISDAVRNISQGDLNTTIEVVGDDEFSAMAENLNKMAEDIRNLMDKEREAERTKNELITNVAHDLRTPLTSIIGYLELLSGKTAPLPEEMRQKYIDIAYSKAKRLEKLIEDLFGFTKLNYGKIAMHVTKVDIIKLLSQLLEESYPNFEKRGLSYELQSNVPARMINADGNLLARLFDNLINNAIKYGAEGKRVTVRVHAEADTVQVSVANYGYVIPAEELPLIFDKFYRVEQSRSTTTGGTGLGLAIVKNIVDMHGGKITVKSDLNGTVFTVTLKVDFDVNKENWGE
jgi:signal transduction histidine kinase